MQNAPSYMFDKVLNTLLRQSFQIGILKDFKTLFLLCGQLGLEWETPEIKD